MASNNGFDQQAAGEAADAWEEAVWVEGSEDRSKWKKNLQKDADGGKLCPGYWVAGKKQGLCFPVLSLPGKGSSPHTKSPPRYQRLVPSLLQALQQQ